MVYAYVQNIQKTRIEVLYDIAKILNVNVKERLTVNVIKTNKQ